MRQILHVSISDYDVEISDDKFEKFKSDLDNFTSGKSRLIVVSQKVYKLYNDKLNLNNENIIIIPDGEKEKNYKNYIKILEKAYKLGLTRNDVMVAIGGGVIGDITGFAAATYMRGIDYIQIPTTLLSMVDSSVGGKTAIDFAGGKNIVGAFYQPKKVFININFLKTLPYKELQSGIGEILKYAFIEKSCGSKQSIFFFEFLTLCSEKFYELDSVTLIRLIDYSLKLKISVVEQDEKESKLRKILNFGHTLGHALEVITNYKKYTHGEAVVYGIFFAFNIAYQRDLIDYAYYRMSVELLEKYNFKNIKLSKFNSEKLVNIMAKDKKATHEKIVFILPCDKKTVKEVYYNKQELADLLNKNISNS